MKIALKDIGAKGKKYSSIIVNDIKMDFSISVISKSMNYNKNKSTDIKSAIKQKLVKFTPTLKKNEIDKKKCSEVPKPTSKLSAFTEKIKAVTMLGKIRSASTAVRTKKTNSIYSNPKKVEEKHQKANKEDNIFNRKIPILQKKPLLNKDKKENNKKEEKAVNKISAQYNTHKPEKNKILSQIIKEEKKPIQKLKTIATEEIFLSPLNYEKYLSDNNQKNKNAKHRETFCEGFFISSFPQKEAQVVEKSQSFPASCGHQECSSLPAMKPEIILRYPLEDTKTLEMNNLAATICFPTGIKVCYSENEPEMIKDYVTPITNQKGERYYMMTFHFYLKMENDIYSKNYEMHPLKHHLMKFADNYLNMSEDEMDKTVTEEIQKNLEQAQELGFRDTIYVPYCICLISKYPYVTQMKKCLQSIYNLIIKNNDNLKDTNEKNKLNYLIMHIINSVPIPEIKTTVQFYIPYFSEGIEIKCPKLNDLKIMNTTISDLLLLFSIDYVVIIFRFLIFEKKILFIDDDYTRLSNVTDSFISLLYPFQWTHTYIPIMSDQMLKYLETFLPFINGINTSLMSLVTEVFQNGDMEESDEMFLIYINKSKFRLGSTLIGKTIKKYKYVEENIPPIPSNLEKELKNKLKKIKDEIESYKKKNPGNTDLSEFDLKIRNAFIEMFVLMFHDIDKYMCFLDEDVVFNKNLFLETVSKEDKKFYSEFFDTQLFQLFTQNIANDELNYFKSMINEYNKNNKFSNDENNGISQEKYIKKIYLITPDYLGIKEKNMKTIENKIKEKYKLNEEKDEEGLYINNKRITEYIQLIDNNNYINSNCNIYLMPENADKTGKNANLNDKSKPQISEAIAKQLKKFVRTKTKRELSEKEQEEIKEKIKDFTVKIFKSEDIETDDTHLKKDLQNEINTNFGREFFISLLSKNSSNIILLKDNAFNLLWTLIYNTLLYLLQIEENSKTLGQIVALLKCTRFFGKEEKETVGYFITEEKKSTVTLWNIYKQKIRGYPKVNQAILWNKWYEINLNLEKEKEKEEVKKRVLLNLCDLMIELELIKSFIKNTLEQLIKKVFGRNEEKNKNILQEVIQKIVQSKYISKPNGK